MVSGGLYFIEDLSLGRNPRWDDTRGEAVMSDILQSWLDQLIMPDGADDAVLDADALRRRKRHPLPQQVAFIFCQAEACVVGKRYRMGEGW